VGIFQNVQKLRKRSFFLCFKTIFWQKVSNELRNTIPSTLFKNYQKKLLIVYTHGTNEKKIALLSHSCFFVSIEQIFWQKINFAALQRDDILVLGFCA